MRFLSRFAIAAFVGFLVSCLIAVGSYSLGLWLGRHGDNLVRLIYDSIPLALLLGLAALLQPRLKVGQQLGPPILAVLVGAAVGLVYSLVVARRNIAFLSLVVLSFRFADITGQCVPVFRVRRAFALRGLF